MSKSIYVEDETWTRLTILKAKMIVESINDVVVKLLEIGEQKILKEVEEKKSTE